MFLDFLTFWQIHIYFMDDTGSIFECFTYIFPIFTHYKMQVPIAILNSVK